MTTRILRLVCVAALSLIGACGQQSSIPSVQPPTAKSDSATSRLLRSGQYQTLETRFGGLQTQFEAGTFSGDDLRAAFRDFYPTDPDLAPKFDVWVTQFPNSYVARVARAIYYKKVGFESRGEAYIRDTSQSQIDGMNAAFGKAVADLRASETMSPKPFLTYFHLLDIGNAAGAKEQLRAIYDLASRLDPTSQAIRVKYMNTLETRWGGSLAEMDSFYEECRKAGLTEAQDKELKGMLSQEKVWLAQR